MNRISNSTILLLCILYVAYVVSDYTTTQWLIANDPQGIENETNPLAQILYTSYGIGGMLLAKSLAYVGIALGVIFIESRYHKHSKVKIWKELTILALIGYSLAVVVNNSLAVFHIGATTDPAIAEWMVKTYGIVFSITLTALVSLAYFSKSHRRALEVTIAVAFLLVPIWILDKFYPLVFESFSTMFIFLIGLIAVIGTVLFLQNRLRTEKTLYPH